MAKLAIEDAPKARQPGGSPRRSGGQGSDHQEQCVCSGNRSRFLEALLSLGWLFQDFKVINSRHTQVLGPIFTLAPLRDIFKACIHLGKVLTREHAQKTGPRLMVNLARAIYLKTILQVSKHGLNRSQMITQSGVESCRDLGCYPCSIHRLEP